MAKYNEILAGRYNKLLQKLMNMKGEAPAPQLATEIQPQIELENPPIELRFLGQWTLWGFGVQVVPAAATNPGVRLRNPTNSGVITVVEKILIAQPSNFSIWQLLRQTGQGAFGNGTDQSGNQRDIRIGTSQGSSSFISFGNAAALSGAVLLTGATGVNVIADLILFEHQEIVLAPNDSITVAGLTQNQAISVGYFWRERAFEPSEAF